MLTWGQTRYKVQSIYSNAYALPTGEWVMFFGERHERTDFFLTKVPPLPPARADAGTFGRVPLRIGSVPSGTDNIVVDFGYSDNGGPENYYCTSRQEACSVVSAGVQHADPFKFAGEVTGGVPCASGCEVELPLLPGRFVYSRIRYRNASGSVIQTEVRPPVSN
jgi:hypothetical protein